MGRSPPAGRGRGGDRSRPGGRGVSGAGTAAVRPRRREERDARADAWTAGGAGHPRRRGREDVARRVVVLLRARGAGVGPRRDVVPRRRAGPGTRQEATARRAPRSAAGRRGRARHPAAIPGPRDSARNAPEGGRRRRRAHVALARPGAGGHRGPGGAARGRAAPSRGSRDVARRGRRHRPPRARGAARLGRGLHARMAARALGGRVGRCACPRPPARRPGRRPVRRSARLPADRRAETRGGGDRPRPGRDHPDAAPLAGRRRDRQDRGGARGRSAVRGGGAAVCVPRADRGSGRSVHGRVGAPRDGARGARRALRVRDARGGAACRPGGDRVGERRRSRSGRTRCSRGTLRSRSWGSSSSTSSSGSGWPSGSPWCARARARGRTCCR